MKNGGKMNLYLIILKNEKKYYVVADDGEEALNKLKEYYRMYNNDYDVLNDWIEVKNIANNWHDLKIGVFE